MLYLYVKYALMSAIVLFCSGCVGQYPVTFDSNPRGAELICSGRNFGHTPVTLYYGAEVHQRTTLDVSNCSAYWVSGYKKSYQSNMPVFPNRGTTLMLQRERGEGYDKDANFALKLRQLKVQEQQARDVQKIKEAAEARAQQSKNQNTLDLQRNRELQRINENLYRLGH